MPVAAREQLATTVALTAIVLLVVEAKAGVGAIPQTTSPAMLAATSRPMPRLCKLWALSDVTHQALPLELSRNGERRLKRAFGGLAMRVEDAAKVDNVEHIEAQIAEIVMGTLVLTPRARRPGPILYFTAPGADLGDDRQVFPIPVQCLLNDLIGDVGAMEIACVD